MATVVCFLFFFPLLNLLPRRHLSPVSNSFYLLLLFFSILLPLFQIRTLFAHSSQRFRGLPRLLFPSIFWAFALFVNVPSPLLSTCPAYFNLLLTSFFLKHLVTQLSVRPVFSYTLSSLPCYLVVIANMHCCFTVSADKDAEERWSHGRRRTVSRGDGGSIPPTAVSKLRQFRSPHIACVFRKRL